MEILNKPHWSIERILGPLLSAVVLVAGTILASRVLGPLPIAVNQTVAERPTTFNVTGTSEITTVPDQVEVNLGVNVQQPTVAGAQDEANQVINSITEQLLSLGIEKEDIKTQNYSINPQYDFSEGGNQRILGYQVNANLRVKLTDFANLNQAIDVATTNGANQVGGIQFTLSEEKEEELKKEARKEAITDAKENAQELATIAGLRLGNLVDVQEGTSEPPVMFSREAMSFDMAAGGVEPSVPTDIQPGSTTYTYRVTLSYQTL